MAMLSLSTPAFTCTALTLLCASLVAARVDEAICDKTSLLQQRLDLVVRGQRDLVFMHVPMNFGNSIALAAAVGSGSTLEYNDVAATAQSGWTAVEKIVQPGAPVWGPLNPDLQTLSELSYPMYYTPAKFWPQDLAEKYFGSKTVFGLLRDPYERMVAYFKAVHGGATAKGWNFTPDGQTCADELNQFVNTKLAPLIQDPLQVPEFNLHPQADYFEGPHAITLPLDLDKFPLSANQVLQEHGYNVTITNDDMIHVTSCDNAWSGDLNEESKSMIKQYYARDFELRCSSFGYCDYSDHCLTYAAGMCPEKLFAWSSEKSMYVALSAATTSQ